MYHKLIITVIISLLSVNSLAISTTDLSQGMTTERMVAELIDTSTSQMTYSNIRYTGANRAAGLFTGGKADGLGIATGIILSSGQIANAIGPNKCYKTTSINKQPGDSDLSYIGGSTYDAAVLEFDFTPDGDTLEFNYVFASDEYLEWTGSKFNDVFGFFLDGKNIALIPNTTTAVAINSINSNSYPEYYRDNSYPHPWTIYEYNNNPCQAGKVTPYQTEFDGFTIVLTAKAKVTPNQPHHLKLAVADRGDYSLDSAVFIQGKSFTTVFPPPIVTLISPNTVISDNTPTYTWHAVATAKNYYLVVKNTHDQIMMEKTLTPTEAQCTGGTGTCSVTAETALPQDNYQWTVQASNSSGKGKISDALSFSVQTTPQQASLIAPNGTINHNKPTYRWNPVANATDYLLQASDSEGAIIINQWVSAKAADCDSGICSITPEVELAEGLIQWWIQAANESGQGPTSDKMPFTVDILITSCKLYAVHDEKLNDSQLCVFEQQSGVFSNLGDIYPGYDLEALEAHPLTHHLYAAAGRQAQEPGLIYQIDQATGALTSLGSFNWEDGTLITDISGLSFNPNTNSLWGLVPKKGLFKAEIDQLPNAPAQLKWSSPIPFGDLTWDITGTALYLAQHNHLLYYDGVQMNSFCSLPTGDKIEALEMTPQGALLLAIDGDATIYILPTPEQVKQDAPCPLEVFKTTGTYYDIEGISWICTTE